MTSRFLAWLAITIVVTLPHDEPCVRLTTDGSDKHRPVWFPDGKRLTFAREESEGSRIWQYVLDPSDPSSLKRLTDRKAGVEYNAAVSPDGSRVLLVVVSLSGTQGNLDIAALKSDGSDLKIVAGDEGGKLSHQDWPSWSPDGRRFAFSSTHEGNQEIYVADADGSNRVRVTQSPGQDAHPCWSPDGKRIAFATDRWGGMELASASPDGTELTRLTKSTGLDDYPAYSPDFQSIAFVSNRDGQFEIYVARADGSKPINVSNHPARDTFPTWTIDGQGVTWVSNRAGGADIFTQQRPPSRP
jgi:Tol biopolymer transport system component